MLNARCKPVTLVAALVAVALGAEATEAHPALVLGAIAGVVYLGLLARHTLRRASLRRTSTVTS